MKRGMLIVTLLVISAVTLTPALAAPGYLGYDPDADPTADLERAVRQGAQEDKRILLLVGGEWCVWCKILQEFLILNEDINQLWSDNFITVKVCFAPENQNEEFLSRFPEIKGYPHLFVLESDGSFLASQRTDELESGVSYSKKKVKKFLEKWSPKNREAE